MIKDDNEIIEDNIEILENEKINTKIRNKILDKIKFEHMGFDMTETSDDDNDENLINKIIELSKNN